RAAFCTHRQSITPTGKNRNIVVFSVFAQTKVTTRNAPVSPDVVFFGRDAYDACTNRHDLSTLTMGGGA
ncbi:MAG: hypothetical protein KDK75_23400, partial [Alphaproteobacteria bacterium]|nr:hypothetical protein [Alphaproteobacteria bacterium]